MANLALLSPSRGCFAPSLAQAHLSEHWCWSSPVAPSQSAVLCWVTLGKPDTLSELWGLHPLGLGFSGTVRGPAALGAHPRFARPSRSARNSEFGLKLPDWGFVVFVVVVVVF